MKSTSSLTVDIKSGTRYCRMGMSHWVWNIRNRCCSFCPRVQGQDEPAFSGPRSRQLSRYEGPSSLGLGTRTLKSCEASGCLFRLLLVPLAPPSKSKANNGKAMSRFTAAGAEIEAHNSVSKFPDCQNHPIIQATLTPGLTQNIPQADRSVLIGSRWLTLTSFIDPNRHLAERHAHLYLQDRGPLKS